MSRRFIFLTVALLMISGSAILAEEKAAPPPTAKIPVEEDFHGTVLTDDYRWLETADDPEVVAWTEAQHAYSASIIDVLPQKEWLASRFNALWRYDDESVPTRVLDGERLFYYTKKKEDEKWVYVTREREGAEVKELLNPNTWPETETLAGISASRDGKYIAFGKAHGGDENPVVEVMVVETGEILPDKLRGWKQSVGSWLPDGSGFYYTCKPLEGEVPEGEHEYWHSAWMHKLGDDPADDVKVFWDDEVKEYWHSAYVTEDGEHTVYYRGLFNANELYFHKTGTDDPLVPLATGLENEYGALFVEDKILITTNEDAPRKMVYITDVDHPERENWQVFIPEHEKDNLLGVGGINGHLYVTYSHNAYTQVKIYDLDGTYIRDLPLPTIGSGGAGGRWSQPEVWVYFSSFGYPSTTFKYHFDKDELEVYRKFPVEVDVDDVVADQVWYDSKDGTPVSMFIVHDKKIKLDGTNPCMLTGYGGFDVSKRPRFSTSALVWLEAGGVFAMPNLRGGGEYGREWHEAGMLDKKQNVFDDFIAAAEFLIAKGYTSSEKLAIIGGSNGGLLVGAVTVQRPDLFRVVECAVPLLDMVTYHRFGLANIWAEEYGSSDDPEQFKYLLEYSPYQNVADGVKYPAFLVTGSENDARVDPMHARKMAARLQAANEGGGPVCLLVRDASGHTGGTTITTRIDQKAQESAFLMHFLGMEAPE
ncbi:MAG: prolyl oligopeptidase family serine peptidase [Candidatus Krumholzibacteriota bacterium]